MLLNRWVNIFTLVIVVFRKALLVRFSSTMTIFMMLFIMLKMKFIYMVIKLVCLSLVKRFLLFVFVADLMSFNNFCNFSIHIMTSSDLILLILLLLCFIFT